MSDDRPSIVELQLSSKVANQEDAAPEMWSRASDHVLAAAPVLLEIVAATLAVEAAAKLGEGYGYGNEATDEQIESWRTELRSAESRLSAALDKVRP